MKWLTLSTVLHQIQPTIVLKTPRLEIVSAQGREQSLAQDNGRSVYADIVEQPKLRIASRIICLPPVQSRNPVGARIQPLRRTS